MKKTVLILCLILFTLNFKSYASDKSFYSISKTILKTVQSNCIPISNNILSFPDTYKNLTTLSNCDLAFTINPKKYASITFDYLRAQQWLGIDVLEEKLNFVNQSYLPDSNFKLINKKVTLERMLKGDKGAFAHFLQQKYTKLSLNEVKKFEQFEDFNILKILYLEEEKLLNLINNYDDLNKYLDHYIKILYKTSSFYRPLISLNLIEIARKKFLKTSHFHSWEIFVQDMPYDVAKKFRIIFSFVDKKFFNNDLLWALKIRTFSEREKFSIYQLGYQKTFSQEMPNNVDTIYFSHLTNLNNIIFGNENGGPRLISLDLINGIHSLEKDHLKLREDYINFFPKIKNIGILNIDPNKLKQKFENFLLKQKSNASNLNEFEKKMLVSDIKNIYLYPYLKDAKYLSGYNYLSLALKNKRNLRIIEDLEDPLEKLIFFMKYERKREPKKSLEIIKSFKKNFNKVCLNKSLEMCDKSWRDINLGYLKSEIYIKNQFTEGPKSCKILKPFKFFYAQLSQKIGPDLYGYYGCNFNNLKQILNIKESHFFEKLPYILTTLGWNDGYYSATNESLLSRGAGFLAEGLLENRLDKRKLKLPHETFNFLETTKDQKAFSYITNINKLKLPIFEKEEIKGDLPYYILSKIYTQLGNFERAFNANYVDLNLPETYSTKLPYAKFTSLSKLAMAKHNLRNMNIPEILIDQFTQPYHERIKQIKNKNESFITKDIMSNSTYNSDIDSMISVLNSYLSPLNNKKNSFKQKEDYLNFAGNIVGKNFQDKSLFCNEKSNRDLLFNLLKTSDGNKYITVATSGIDMFLFYEFAEVYFKCLNTELYTLKDKDLNSFKNFSKINYVLKNDFNKVLKLGFNYIDPRNIYSVLFLSNLARRVDNIYLSLMAVTSLEYMYQNLTNAFIKQNSLSLRLYQKFIEEIIVNTSISLSRFKPNNEKEEKLKEILGFKIKILSSSAKRVLLTNNSRLRYLGFDNQIFNNEKYLSSLLKKSSILKYNFNNLKKLTTFYKSLDQDISQSESLIDYVRTKSKYSEHGSDFFIDPFVDYRTYKQIKNTKFKFNIYSL